MGEEPDPPRWYRQADLYGNITDTGQKEEKMIISELIIKIQASLKEEVHFELKHDTDYGRGSWHASLVTERNDYPHWIRYTATTPDMAVKKLMDFLNGTRPDHADIQRSPEAFKLNRSSASLTAN